MASLLDCMGYRGCRNVVAEDFRKRMAFVEIAEAVHKDIEAVVVDAIVVFVDRDVVVQNPVDWDWGISDTDAMYFVAYCPMVVVRIFDSDQQEGGYYSDN